jgi:hypothetical protein
MSCACSAGAEVELLSLACAGLWVGFPSITKEKEYTHVACMEFPVPEVGMV